MEFNNKKLNNTARIINITISLVLFVFLVSLSTKFIGDMDNLSERPQSYNFQNNTLIDSLRKENNEIQKQIEVIQEKKSTISNSLSLAKSNYKKEKESYNNWLSARQTIGSPTEDNEIISRANKIDEFYKIAQDWEKEMASLDAKTKDLRKKINSKNELIQEEEDDAFVVYQAELRAYDLKIFLYRLLFIFPLLLLGAYFVIKLRNHKYWPLFFGYVLFSIYAFFFGLVPYLPSYGGYIRYGVGIVLCVVGGIYIINKIKSFIERKKQELEVSSQERAKNVKVETAEKALENHMCPSCGKDFISKVWDNLTSGKGANSKFGSVTNFCRYCGLELFKKCKKCETQNFAHLPYCSNCGDKIMN